MINTINKNTEIPISIIMFYKRSKIAIGWERGWILCVPCYCYSRIILVCISHTQLQVHVNRMLHQITSKKKTPSNNWTRASADQSTPIIMFYKRSKITIEWKRGWILCVPCYSRIILVCISHTQLQVHVNRMLHQITSKKKTPSNNWTRASADQSTPPIRRRRS